MLYVDPESDASMDIYVNRPKEVKAREWRLTVNKASLKKWREVELIVTDGSLVIRRINIHGMWCDILREE